MKNLLGINKQPYLFQISAKKEKSVTILMIPKLLSLDYQKDLIGINTQDLIF